MVSKLCGLTTGQQCLGQADSDFFRKRDCAQYEVKLDFLLYDCEKRSVLEAFKTGCIKNVAAVIEYQRGVFYLNPIPDEKIENFTCVCEGGSIHRRVMLDFIDYKSNGIAQSDKMAYCLFQKEYSFNLSMHVNGRSFQLQVVIFVPRDDLHEKSSALLSNNIYDELIE